MTLSMRLASCGTALPSKNRVQSLVGICCQSWPARWTVLLGSALAMVNYCVMAYVDVFRPDLMRQEVEEMKQLDMEH